jgi:hypothetical protein
MGCRDVKWAVHDRGFRNVLSVSCAGRAYIFSALRDGDPVRVYASGETGQISKVVPGY